MASSALSDAPPIGDHMNPRLTSSLTSIYRFLLNAYPPSYRVQFENEMFDTFVEGVDEAGSLGTLASFLLREFREMPKSLINAYWNGWMGKLWNGIHILEEVTSSSDLPPAPPDGRNSWRQVVWETSLFLFWGLLLILATYVPFPPLHAGWQHDLELLGKVIVPVVFLVLLLGLLRGLPRWAYPFSGLLLGYQGMMARQNGLSLFLLLMVVIALMLAIASIVTNPYPSRLSTPMRRITQSLSQDWTRFSFAFYGAMPLVILQAFDDSHYDNRTPYLACSVLAMIVCAFLYCRSRDRQLQISFLLLGVTLSIWGAWLDKIAFADGLVNWIMVSSRGTTGDLWILKLWFQWALLILLPYFVKLLGRVGILRPAA